MSASSERTLLDRARARACGRGAAAEKLLPDSQPSYVSSWIYVFGVLSLASLVVIIASGSILALKGPGWWHFTGIGHFFNSVHLWAVELFFFFMVIHLWGKYWMAAWRGGRARVWMTGAVTFLVAIPCALTGYVSQQNFDAQWISTQAKDAMNAAGVGAFFNLSNFGQMYSYHVLLLPGRRGRDRGRAHPAGPQARGRAAVRAATVDRRRPASNEPQLDPPRRGGVVSRRERRAQDERYREWKGGYRPYDLVKEASIALGVVLALAVVLTILFSSPDEPPSTIKQWSRTDPVDFVTTATTELDGTSGTGGYGPPYNHASTGSTSRSSTSRSGSASATRSTPPRTSCSRRCARSPVSRRCRRRSTSLPSRASQAADGVDERLRERRSAKAQGQPDGSISVRPEATGRSRR